MFRPARALITRELQADSRRLAPSIMRLILGVILLLAVVSAQSQSLTLLSPGLLLLTWVMCANVAVGTMIVPVYLASAIGEEKEQRTLPLLLVADLGAGTILLGKLAPLLAAVVMVLLVQLPFVMLSITLGGVLLGQIAGAYVSLAAYLLAAAGISLLCSVCFSGSFRPVAYALCVVLALLIGPRLMQFWALTMLDRQAWAVVVEPVHAALTWLVEADLLSRQTVVLDALFSGGLVGDQVFLHLGCGAVATLLAFWRFRIATADGGEPPVARAPVLGRRAHRSWRLAITWKEFAVSGGGWRFFWAKLVAYGLLLLVAWLATARWRWDQLTPERFSEVALWSLLGIILPFELLWMAVRMFEPEVREQTLGTLVILPQSTAPLIWQKWLGGVMSLAPVIFWLAITVIASPDQLPQWLWEAGLAKWVEGQPWVWAYLLSLLAFMLLLISALTFIMNGWRAIVASLVASAMLFQFIRYFADLVLHLSDSDHRTIVAFLPNRNRWSSYILSPDPRDLWRLQAVQVAAALAVMVLCGWLLKQTSRMIRRKAAEE